jgi:hypothetical protein
VNIRSTLEGFSAADGRRALSGLPEAREYEIWVKPLRYRTNPHLAALTEWDEKRITLQVPVPFRPFREPVQYGAKRIAGKGMRFKWLAETVDFRNRRDVLRFLYCHEWMHTYLYHELGRKSAAETTCDRFALLNFRKRTVTRADADSALRRRRD